MDVGHCKQVVEARSWTTLLIVLIFFGLTLISAPNWAQATGLRAVLDSSGDKILIFRDGKTDPILTQVAKPDFRPYLHPIVVPDEKGIVTELSPDHHPHQTGIFWGFTGINQRDYFHHPQADYWRRASVSVLKGQATDSGDSVQWQTSYELLDAAGQPIFQQSQVWTMRDLQDRYILDLQWTGIANQQLSIDQADYGGLFLRMPWRSNQSARVINSRREVDQRAEGQRTVWLDIGMQLAGREDHAHIAILDHPSNKGFPQAWRIDGQLGVGPVPTRDQAWQMQAGQQETIRHRLLFYTGSLNDAHIAQQWSEYTGLASEWVEWQLAQQEGLQAEMLSPQQAADQMTLQPDFAVNVFAAEPMISQPMAFCWDSRGRLWVAENRDYETRQTGFSSDGTSRILILEDTDRDGKVDKSQVFLEGIPFPSAIAVGLGGLWLGAPPNLLFVPDADNDDRADTQSIQVRLTGWGILDRHETLNSLHWGPDGWLYGLQGFATPSRVGKPLGPGKLYRHNEPFPEDVQFDGPAVDINGGVWRYHPTQQKFEVVAHGFSNPWGIDHDEHGQLLITACVIPHLWHVIPGGIYHRQGGRHFNPYVYSDIQTIAQHRHRSAHGGARVYQSDAFPKEYHGRVFMANIHEHALLTDIVQASGSGLVARHGDDFALANNAQWIGFSVEIGPAGDVYVLDWHDADICGKQVLNKGTGRIFRYTYNKSSAGDFPNRFADLDQLSDQELADLQGVPSAWHANRSRLILQHRSQSRSLSSQAIGKLNHWLSSQHSEPIRLRALWALYVSGAISQEGLHNLLDDPQPYLRAWAIQLLTQGNAAVASGRDDSIQQMIQMARQDSSPIVRLYLASAAQRLDSPANWMLLENLAEHAEDAEDHNLPKMIWFALEPLVTQDPARALKLAQQSRIPLISQFVARRLADADKYELLLDRVTQSDQPGQIHILIGMRQALDGRFDVPAPNGWAKAHSSLHAQGGRIAEVADQLAEQFGDLVAATKLLETVKDPQRQAQQRRQAIGQLAGRARPELAAELPALLEHPELRVEAIRAIAAYHDRKLAELLVKLYPSFTAIERQEVIYSLANRSEFGHILTSAIAQGSVPKNDIPAHVARLLRRSVGNRFVDVWGPIDELAMDKEVLLTKYRELLHPQAIAQANVAEGKLLFQRNCGTCHQMHGQGGKLGPDITGANRGNLEYLLSNVVTPSAIIQDDYRMHIVLTDDGRIYSGIPTDENQRQLRLRVVDREDPVVIPQSEIQSREIAQVSMMPDGILANLNDSQIVNLFGYLQREPAATPTPHADEVNP